MGVAQPLPAAEPQSHAWQIRLKGCYLFYFIIFIILFYFAQNLPRKECVARGQRTGRPPCRVAVGWAEPSWGLRIHQPITDVPGGEHNQTWREVGATPLMRKEESRAPRPWENGPLEMEPSEGVKLYRAAKPLFQRKPQIENRQKQRRSPQAV